MNELQIHDAQTAGLSRFFRLRRLLPGVVLGIILSLFSLILSGCGGSGGDSSDNTLGLISGTLTRVILPIDGKGDSIYLPGSDTEVQVYQGTVIVKKTQTDQQGRFTLSLPAGHYRVKSSDAILERTPAEIGSQEVDVVAGQTHSVALEVTLPSI